jgi:hypothetical protein
VNSDNFPALPVSDTSAQSNPNDVGFKEKYQAYSPETLVVLFEKISISQKDRKCSKEDFGIDEEVAEKFLELDEFKTNLALFEPDPEYSSPVSHII